MANAPNLLGVYLFVRDLPTTLAFYKLLGLDVEEVSSMYARATLPNGASIEFGTSGLTRSYDPTWKQSAGPATNTIGFEFPTRDAVDSTYTSLVDAGFTGRLAPCDPPWQARFALVDDPDGNIIGLHSPRNRVVERKREQVGAG